ncbi:MAG: tetratricopeptide repeat protein, partial [Kofleriaceae bacterium]|nr:tetratricopeptide repeat protein [Kofleriaceae bacterium]
SDFGLAALAGEPAAGAVGTPGFLAPELAEGAAMDARTDQYAFAVTAWQTLFDAAPGEHGHGAATRVLERALARDPAARWPSMHEVARALERRTRRWWWAAVPLVAALGLGIVIWSRHEAAACSVDDTPLWTPAARTAWVERVRVVAGAAADTLANDVDRSFQLWREASHEACSNECLASTRRKLAAFVAHAPASKNASAAQAALAGITSAKLCLQAPAQRPMAPELAAARAPFKAALDEVATLQSLGQYDAALEKLDALVAQAPAADPALRGELLYRKADAMARAGRVGDSVPVLEEALQIAERAGNDVARLNAIILLLTAYEELGKAVEATALAKIAEAAAQRVPRDPSVHARLYAVLGSLAYDRGDHAVAERHYGEVVRLQQEMLGDQDPAIAGSLHNLGLAVHLAGRLDEARQIQERSLAMFEATVGAKHPDTALPVGELAGIALEQGKPAEATVLYERALAIHEAALGPEHPYLSETLIGLARSLARLGRSDEAIAALRRAIDLAAALDEHHPLGAIARYWLAKELDHRGRHAPEIVPLLEHGIASWEASKIALPEAGWTKFLLAKYRWAAGDRAAARKLAAEAQTALAALSAPYAKEAKEVEAWIAKH